jgi:hypothetical protein
MLVFYLHRDVVAVDALPGRSLAVGLPPSPWPLLPAHVWNCTVHDIMRNLTLSSHKYSQIALDHADSVVAACVNDEQEHLFVASAHGVLALFSTAHNPDAQVRPQMQYHSTCVKK